MFANKFAKMHAKMNVKIIALTVAALATVALPNTADARCRGCAVGAGVIGGLAVGAIIGSAIANGQPRYAEPQGNRVKAIRRRRGWRDIRRPILRFCAGGGLNPCPGLFG